MRESERVTERERKRRKGREGKGQSVCERVCVRERRFILSTKNSLIHMYWELCSVL